MSSAQNTEQEQLLCMLECSISRMNHLEQLLVAFATLAMMGWGFLYNSMGEFPTNIGLVVFSILFSGLVGSAFNSLYLGRMASNIRILDLEQLLCTNLKPFANYQNYAGGSAGSTFYFTAFFVPVVAFLSLLFTCWKAEVWSKSWLEMSIVCVLMLGALTAIISSMRKTFSVIRSYLDRINSYDPAS